jgi:hypothetical protein
LEIAVVTELPDFDVDWQKSISEYLIHDDELYLLST